MEQSYNRAHDLQQAQQSQAQLLAAQFKVQDEMQFKAQVSQALLEKVAISAANLHSMIDDATVKFKRTPGLHSGGISAWTVCALLLILIGGQSTRMAISLFFLILGKSLLISLTGETAANVHQPGHIIATFCYQFF
jgi:hypothetical protein